MKQMRLPVVAPVRPRMVSTAGKWDRVWAEAPHQVQGMLKGTGGLGRPRGPGVTKGNAGPGLTHECWANLRPPPGPQVPRAQALSQTEPWCSPLGMRMPPTMVPKTMQKVRALKRRGGM